MMKQIFAIILAISTIASNSYSMQLPKMQLPEGDTEVARITQPNGKITVVVKSFDVDGTNTVDIYRYNSNGSPDASFEELPGFPGMITLHSMIEGNPLDVESIDVQADGKILITLIKNGNELNILRLDEHGIDPTFGISRVEFHQKEKLP